MWIYIGMYTIGMDEERLLHVALGNLEKEIGFHVDVDVDIRCYLETMSIFLEEGDSL